MEISEDSESTISVRNNLMTLQREFSKLLPDLEVISVKLDQTASYRMKRIYDPEVTLTEILSEFPALRLRNFVSKHF